MRLLAIGIILSIVIHYTLANCKIEGYSGTTINNENAVDDDVKDFISIPTINVVSADLLSSDNYPYVDVRYADDVIHFVATSAFASYEKDNPFTSAPRVSTAVTLKCEDSSTITVTFHQTINDKNNHHPNFNMDSYTFKLPMPFPGGVALTEFGEAIDVTDIDITNTGIDFEIVEEGTGLSITSLGPVDGNMKKTHRAILRAKSPLRLTEAVTYTVRATDRGSPTLNSTTTIRIEVDESGSIPTSPQFELGHYTATYNIEGDKHSISDIPIPITGGVTQEDVKLSGLYQDLFEHLIENNHLKISLKDQERLPESVISDKDFIVLDISASVVNADAIARTSLIISMPPKITVEFESGHYTATYNNEGPQHSISHIPIPVSEGVAQGDVKLSGEYESRFEHVIENNQLKISLKEEAQLPDSVISDKDFVALDISATNGNAAVTARTSLIISMPPKITVEFESGHYTATYNSEDTQHSISHIPIPVSEGVAQGDVKLSGEYESLFEHVIENNQLKISLKEGAQLPDLVISDNDFVALDISATNGNAAVTARTSLIISMPPKITVEFESGHYTATYNNEGTQHSISHTPIPVTEGVAQGDVKLSGEYESLFEHVIENNQLKISLKEQAQLPDLVISDNDFVALDISATNGNAAVTARTSLIISMPPKITVEFESGHYTATYNNEGTPHSISHIPIPVSEGVAQGDVKLSGEYESRFEHVIENNQLKISLKEQDQLPDQVISDNDFVALDISATNGNAAVTARTSLIISMPPKITVEFESGHYTATYNNEGTQHSISHIPIPVSEGVAQGDVKLSGEYENLFEHVIENNQLTISLKEQAQLPDQVISDNDFVALDISATNGNAAVTARTSLIISMPPKITVEFESGHYTATYNNEGTQHSISHIPIPVSEGVAQGDVKLSGEYENLFEHVIENNQLTISLKEQAQLPDQVISDNDFVALDISATNGNAAVTARTSLIISMPPKITVEFESGHYTATYNNEGTQHSISHIPIPVSEGVAQGDVKLSGEYENLFEHVIENNQLTISLKEQAQLPDQVISDNDFVALDISATNGNAAITDRTSLIISMPPKVTVEFESGHYTATYNNEGIQHSISHIPIPVSEGVAQGDVKLSGEYESRFEHVIENNQLKISLKEQDQLPDQVISDNDFVALDISATNGNAAVTARTSLIISMPPKITVEFESGHYTATYNNEGTQHSITHIPIPVSEGVAQGDVKLSGEYESRFEHVIENNQLKISLKEQAQLPDQVISDNDFVALDISATNGNAAVTDRTSLIISMPPKVTVEFESGHYTATYNNEGIQHSISHIPIPVSEGVAQGDVKLSGEYESRFEHVIENNQLKISLKEQDQLPDQVISDNDFVALDISATNGNAAATARTSLIISMPPKITVEFESGHYTATYNNEGTQHSINHIPIPVSEGVAQGDVKLSGEYENLFEHVIENNQLKISLKEQAQLPDQVISDNDFVALDISATNGNAAVTDRTSLIISMPPKVTVEFESGHYTATYNNEGIQHSISHIPIPVSEGVAQGDVKLSGEYESRFEHVIENNKLKISLKEQDQLPDQVISDNDFVALDISATNGNAAVTARTSLIISMPPKITVEFESGHYTATYNNEGTQHSITHIPIPVSEGVAQGDVKLSGEYESRFEHVIENNQLKIRLKEQAQLPDQVISDNNFVALDISATNGNAAVTDRTSLIISMPPKVTVEFESGHYTATYNNEGIQHSISHIPIPVSEGVAQGDVKLSGEYESRFEHVIENNQLKISLKEQDQLPDQVISDNDFVALDISATNGNAAATARTSLIISMPPKITVEFESGHYTATYNNEGTQHSINHIPIPVSEGVAQGDVKLSGEYENLFEHVIENNQLKISLKEQAQLPDQVISDNDFVALDISATNGNAAVTDRTSLIISMPPKVTVEFESGHYTATYDNEGTPHSISHIPIPVSEGVAQGDVKLSGEYESRFEHVIENNQLTISLKEATQLPDSIISDNDFVALDISATNGNAAVTARTSLIISMPPKITVEFESGHYTATYNNEGTPHSISHIPIPVSEGVAQGDVKLSGEYESLFEHVIENNQLKISLKGQAQLPDSVISDKDFVALDISATNGNAAVTARTSLIISMPPKITVEFDAFFYEADYNNEDEPHSMTSVILDVSDGATITFEEDYQNNFAYDEATKTVTLAKQLPDSALSLPCVHVEITANIGSSAAKAALVISMPNRKIDVAFDTVFYETNYNIDEGTHTMDPVRLEVTDGATVTFEYYEGIFAYDEVTKTVTLAQKLPDNVISLPYVSVEITGIIASGVARAVLIVSMQFVNTNPPAVEITFTDQYIFEKEPGENIKEFVIAISTINEEIGYSLNGNVPPQVELYSNGELRSVDLPTGFYDLQIVAEGSLSKVTAVAPLKISIGSALICDDEIKPTYSFLTKTVTEEQEDETIILPKLNGYSYEIEKIEPSQFKFDINPASGHFVAKTLDRESDEFINGKAQYIARIKLVADTSRRYSASNRFMYTKSLFSPKENRAVRDDDQCYVISDIKIEPDIITVGINVEDINDNEPEFAESRIFTGYPEAALLPAVSPSYLLKVEATDQDSGVNAVIEYAVSSDRVVIDPITGYIYPTDKMYGGAAVTFEVTATDEEGNGRSSEVSVTVKFLKEVHLSILKYQNKHLEDLDGIIKELRNYADVRYLSASVLPGSKPYNRAGNSNDRSLIIVAYAFDSEENLMTAEELKEILDDVDGLTIESLPNTGGTINPEDEETSDTGLIVAVSILAVLLALCIIGFIAFYFLIFRKKKSYDRMEEGGLPKPETKQSALGTPRFTKNSGPTPSAKPDVDLHERRPTGYIYPVELLEERPPSPTAPPEALNGEIRERRKSVVFNSNVEEINIEREADDQEGEKKAASDNSQTDNSRL